LHGLCGVDRNAEIPDCRVIIPGSFRKVRWVWGTFWECCEMLKGGRESGGVIDITNGYGGLNSARLFQFVFSIVCLEGESGVCMDGFIDSPQR